MGLLYKYRIKGVAAMKILQQHAYACNQVWNWCVAQQRDLEARYRAGAPKRRWLSHFDLAAECRGVGRELGIHQQTVQGVCEQFAVSRDRFGRSPKFRVSGGARRSLGWVPFQKQSRQLSNNSITYLGHTFRWFGSKRRPLPESATGGCFVEDALGHWYVCFYVEVYDLPTGAGSVGIDLGLKTLATLSDGSKVDNHRPFRSLHQKLATAQRAKNKRRARAIHAKIANKRRDHLHKESCRIARENALIAVGNVNSSKLMKTRFAKSVSDAGWSMFRNMLRYKASRHGATYMDIDERFTTQVCSSCGVIPSSSPKGMGALGIRSWECSECGSVHDRDVNAAKNILRIALSTQRPDEERLPSAA